MLDSQLIRHLERQEIPFCLIGGLALAAWGVARYTAAADLLTLDPRILGPAGKRGSLGAPCDEGRSGIPRFSAHP